MANNATLSCLQQFESYINKKEFDTAKRLFDSSTHAFGTWTYKMNSLNNLYEQQWLQIWKKIKNFSFDWDSIDLVLDPKETVAHIAICWSTEAIDMQTNEKFTRPGRATLLLIKEGLHWKGRHSHFSLHPKFNMRANTLKEQ